MGTRFERVDFLLAAGGRFDHCLRLLIRDAHCILYGLRGQIGWFAVQSGRFAFRWRDNVTCRFAEKCEVDGRINCRDGLTYDRGTRTKQQKRHAGTQEANAHFGCPPCTSLNRL